MKKEPSYRITVDGKRFFFPSKLFSRISQYLQPKDFFNFSFGLKSFFKNHYHRVCHICFIEFLPEKTIQEKGYFSKNLITHILNGQEVHWSKKNPNIKMMKENEKMRLLSEYEAFVPTDVKYFSLSKKATQSEIITTNEKTIENKISEKKNVDSSSDSEEIKIEEKKPSQQSTFLKSSHTKAEKNFRSDSIHFYIDIYGLSASEDINLIEYLESKKFVRKIMKRYSGVFFLIHNDEKNVSLYESRDTLLKKVKDFARVVTATKTSLMLFGFAREEMLKITGSFSLHKIKCYDIQKLNEMRNFEKQRNSMVNILNENMSKNSIRKLHKATLLKQLVRTEKKKYDELMKKLINFRVVKFSYFKEKEGKLMDICQILRMIGFQEFSVAVRLALVKRLFNNFVFVNLEKKKGIRVLRNWNYKGSSDLKIVKSVYTPPTFIVSDGDIHCDFWLSKETQYFWFFEKRALIIPSSLFAILGNSNGEMSLKIPTTLNKLYKIFCMLSCYYCFNNKKLKL